MATRAYPHACTRSNTGFLARMKIEARLRKRRRMARRDMGMKRAPITNPYSKCLMVAIGDGRGKEGWYVGVRKKRWKAERARGGKGIATHRAEKETCIQIAP